MQTKNKNSFSAFKKLNVRGNDFSKKAFQNKMKNEKREIYLNCSVLMKQCNRI